MDPLDRIDEVIAMVEGARSVPMSRNCILDRTELSWLEQTLGSRVVVYDHGGHLGNIGERQQVADMLEMLAGRWRGAPR